MHEVSNPCQGQKTQNLAQKPIRNYWLYTFSVP
jgi:hypothetical protein